jgi:hypothetical protein
MGARLLPSPLGVSLPCGTDMVEFLNGEEN